MRGSSIFILFQSLLGILKSISAWPAKNATTWEFQSLLGILKSHVLLIVMIVKIMFQSLLGILKSHLGVNNCKITETSFNPS